MDIIFEVETRPDQPPHTTRLTIIPGGSIRIGRAYDNDIILSDAYVSPHHGRISIDENGQWWYEDLDSLNGTWADKNQHITGRKQLSSGDALRVGLQTIRVYSMHHAIPPTLKFEQLPWVLRAALNPLWLAVFIVAGALLDTLDEWLALTEQRKFNEWISNSISYFVVLLLWACFWALIGKVARREARFAQQLAVAVFFIIAFIFINELAWFLNFNIGQPLVEKIFRILVTTLTLGSAFWYSIKLAIHTSRPLWRWLSYGSVAFVMTLTLWLTAQEHADFSPKPDYVGIVAPPILLLHEGKPIEQFIKDSQFIFNVESKK